MSALAHDSTAQPGIDWHVALPYSALAIVGALYLVAAVLRAREPRGWNHWRTTGFLIGIATLMIAVGPSLSDSFGDHMLGHLLIGMFAPLTLVLAAPMTLILRSVHPRWGRSLVHVLRSKPAGILTNPAVLLTANLGGLALLYFTPLFEVAEANSLVHSLIHVHFFIAGYLFAWMIAGPDPGPDRPSVRTRLVILGVAIAGHAVIAQLLYAGIFVKVPAPQHELEDGGTLMYYWGDIAEILLALALLLTWRPDHRTQKSRGRFKPTGFHWTKKHLTYEH